MFCIMSIFNMYGDLHCVFSFMDLNCMCREVYVYAKLDVTCDFLLSGV